MHLVYKNIKVFGTVFNLNRLAAGYNTNMRKMCCILILAAISLLLAGCSSGSSGTSGAPALYIQNKGSDTIVNLALGWAERYQALHPDVSISVTGGGSGTGIAALINDTVDIANASRAIKDEEIKAAQANGVEPVEFVVSQDAIGVIVHRDNPIDRLTLQEISWIYTGRISNWQELGGDDRPIVKLSRETNSGTHVYFLEEVIRLGDSANKEIFSADTLLLPSSEGIIAEVRENPNAIGYDGLGYITDDVKIIAVAVDDASAYVLPTVDTVNDGTYPIARYLYMYTIGQPTGAVKDYMEWIMQAEAQQIVKDLGFVPIVAE